MKIALEMEINDTEKINKILDIISSNKTDNQQKNNSDKKVLCMKCKKDIYTLYTTDEATKVIGFSNSKYGKPLCRDCQLNYRGDTA